VVVFVDDDVTVTPGWAAGIRDAMAAHPNASFVVGRLLVPPGQEDAEHPVAIRDGVDPTVVDGCSRGAVGHSANLAVRRAALEDVAGFDEALGAGGTFRACEDGDLLDRLFACGRAGRYEPAALAYHDQWRDRRALLRLDWAYGVGFGARLAKLVRLDPRRARNMAWDFVWVWGLALVPRAVRTRYKLGTVAPLLRVAGTLVGLVLAAPLRIRDGHLRVPGRLA